VSEIASKLKRLPERFLGRLMPLKRARGQSEIETGRHDAFAVTIFRLKLRLSSESAKATSKSPSSRARYALLLIVTASSFSSPSSRLAQATAPFPSDRC
jgi:hypothetical protein